MDGEVSLSGYTLLMMSGFRAGLGATVEVQSCEDVQGWPKELVMGCENFQNLCVVIGGTIGGWGACLPSLLHHLQRGFALPSAI